MVLFVIFLCEPIFHVIIINYELNPYYLNPITHCCYGLI